MAGGVAALAIGYGAYYVSPAGKMSRKISSTAKEANAKYDEAAKKLQEATPNADQAIDYIRNFAYSYVAWVPGGRHYVDTAFADLDKIRQNHREDVDKIVNDAYRQFQDIAKSGLSMESAQKAYEAIADLAKKVGYLTGDAFQDIVDNHPQLKEKVGGNLDQLKQMGEQYGPDAQKQVEETWNQIRDIMAGGLSASSIAKAKSLIDEKVDQVRKMGDEAWKKGLEQAKPYLDKNPKIKEMVEKNADALKQGNVTELFQKLKSAVESGDMGGLEEYVNGAVDKAKSKGSEMSGGNLDKYFNMVPGGSEILPKLMKFKEVAEQHKDEGEKLLKETIDEVQQVLQKKSQRAQEIVDKAKKEAK